MLAGLLGAAIGGAAVMFALPAELFGRVPTLAGEVTADASQVAVVNGDTLRLHETVVRLTGVSAPPRGQSCARSKPDGAAPAFDCGAASSEALASLVRGQRVACRLQGRDSSGFPRAQCEAAGVDLNRAQITAGWARAHSDSPTLAAEEAVARDARRGIWREGDAPSF